MSADRIIHLFDAELTKSVGVADGVTVICVVDDDLDEDRDLIGDIVRALGGLVFDLPELYQAGVVGTTASEPELRSAVETFMVPAAPKDKPFEFRPDGGRLSASFGSEKLVLSESGPTLLGSALLPFANELGSVEMAAVVWEDTSLDVQAATAVWGIVNHLSGRQLGKLKRLFVFAGGSIRHAVHLNSLQPTQYWMDRGALHAVKGQSHLSHWTKHLADQQASGRPMVFVLGAGFSSESGAGQGIPLGDSLRDDALAEMFSGGTERSRLRQFYDLVSENALWTPAERAGHLPSREEFCESLTLERVLLVEFTDWEGRERSPTLQRLQLLNDDVIAAPSPGVVRFHEILAATHNIVVVTVNFDELVETAPGVRFNVLASPDELDRADQVIGAYLAATEERAGSEARPVPILKLHGTIGDLDTVIADVRRVADGLSDAVSRAMEQLTNDSEPVPWIYIGHSMRDADLVRVLAQRRFGVGTDEIWVAPSLPPPVRRFAAEHRAHYWQERRAYELQMRHLTVTSDRFLIELANVWPA